MMTNAPINILMVTGIFPPDIGGPATYVPTMASELVKRGHRVVVVTLSDRLDLDDCSYTFPVHRIRRSLAKPLRFLLTVMRIVREGRSATVLYVNGLYLEAVIANFLICKPMVQKIVGDWAWERVTNKGWVRDTFEEFQKRKYDPRVGLLKALRNFCVARADAVIVPSKFLARAVATWGISETKMTVIYNAVELSAPIAAAIPLATRFKIVTVGRLVPWKQIDHLIEAIHGCPDAGLVIIGDGPERSQLENLTRKNQLGSRIYFAGQRSKEETLALMAACDLFVLNSSYEGFPHVLLEAMSAGLPVMATAAGGTPELVEHGVNGILIPSNGQAALTRALMHLLSCDDQRRRLAAGAQSLLRRFQSAEMIRRTESILVACRSVSRMQAQIEPTA